MAKIPKVICDFLGYSLFFFSSENREPVHVLISKGTSYENNSKILITQDGQKVAHNESQIPHHDLAKILHYITANRSHLLNSWYTHFGYL